MYQINIDYLLVASGKGNTGDGHRIAEEIGAYLKDVEHVKPSFGMHVSGTSAVEIFHGYYHGAIIVNKRGARFVNESKPYKDIGQVALDQPDGIGFQIFDQAIFDKAVRLLRECEVVLGQESKGLDRAKIAMCVKADTIAGLASRINVAPEALEGVVNTYNSDVDLGRDRQFGRSSLAGGAGRLEKIIQPPFYAYETKGLMAQTTAGIAVDENMHVLSKNGKLSGLYAAGEIVGGFHGANYMSGSSVGKALIFGRIAGRNAVKGK